MNGVTEMDKEKETGKGTDKEAEMANRNRETEIDKGTETGKGTDKETEMGK